MKRLILGLTRAENEILLLLLQGKSNKEIGASRCRSVYTVKNQIHKIFTKTGARNRVHLMWLVQEGLSDVSGEKAYRHHR